MKKLALLLFLLFSVGDLFSFDIPKLKSYVNDYADVMTDKARIELDAVLKDYQSKTGNQFFVLTVESMQDAGSVEQYSIAVAEKWKAGFKGSDNGIIMVVAVKDRRLRIEVGYGLEGKLPDVVASRIIRQEITPRFKRGLYSDGITAGVVSVLNALGGYDTKNIAVAPVERKRQNEKPWSSLVLFVIVLAVILFRWVLLPLNRVHGGRPRSSGGGFFFGGPGGGGFSGGGFGGGGGGGFGGGGASGSW